MNYDSPVLVAESISPFTIEFVMVLCCGMRFMAYLDLEGKWRTAFDNRELEGPVRVLW